MISDDSDGFISFMKETIIQESTTDLAHESELGATFTVLDVGCNVGKDIRLWNSLGCKVYYGFDTCSDAIQSIGHLNLHGLTTKVNVKIADAAADATWNYANIDMAIVLHSLDYICSDRVVFKSTIKNIAECLSHRGRVLILVREAFGADHDLCTLTSSDGDCPSFKITRESLRKEAQDNGLEVVIDENVAVVAAWMGINSPITTSERSFMYYGTHKQTLLKWCKTETPSGIGWLHATKHRFMLFRKAKLCIGNTMRDSLAVWKARLKSGTLGELI
jgi:SAM-dependent methyltransferase